MHKVSILLRVVSWVRKHGSWHGHSESKFGFHG